MIHAILVYIMHLTAWLASHHLVGCRVLAVGKDRERCASGLQKGNLFALRRHALATLALVRA